jgi:hypothetical protein
MSGVYEIVHAYTGEVEGMTSALSAVDALAHFSLALGYADPRETAAQTAEEGREADGYAWGDPFYRCPEGTHPERENLLGMVIENWACHAVPVEAMTCASCDTFGEAHESLLCADCEQAAAYGVATHGGTMPHVSHGDGADGWPIWLAAWHRETPTPASA